MSFIKKLVGKIQNYKNEEVVYAEDYNKDFNLLREVINNNAEGIAETQTSVSELNTDVQNLVEGTVTISSINGSAIIDNTLPYNALSTDALNKLPNKNELTDLNDNVVKSYFYNTALPSADLHNAIIKRYTEAEQTTAADVDLQFALNENSFIDAPAEFTQYIAEHTPNNDTGVVWASGSIVSSYADKSQVSNRSILENTTTRLRYYTNLPSEAATLVKKIIITNKDRKTITSSGPVTYVKRYIDSALTMTVSYTDGTNDTLTIPQDTVKTLTVALNGTTPKPIAQIYIDTENITGFFGMMTDCSIDYPEVTLKYDTSKNDKIITGPTLTYPSEYVYIHIISSAVPKAVTVLNTEGNTTLSDYKTQLNTITGFNEYIYKFDCSEDRSKANNLLVKIETTNASDKIYGYYIVG